MVKLRLLNENHKRRARIRTVQPTRCEVSQFIYFCKTLYMFQTVFPSIIGSSKLHIQHQVFVRPIPDVVRAVLNSWWWTVKPSKHVERLTEKIEKRRIFLVVFWEYISDTRTYESYRKACIWKTYIIACPVDLHKENSSK